MSAGGAGRRRLEVRHESFPIRGSFRISRGAKTTAEVVVAELRDGDTVGRGECVPYTRYGETVDGVMTAMASAGDALAAGADRAALATLLPAGAARNALDCALWDLEAKLSGGRVWDLAGVPAPGPLTTAYTLSLDTVEAMGAAARAVAGYPLLKLKLSGAGDLDRVRAVRANAPQARLMVDANEAWTLAELQRFAPDFAALGVVLIEQPLPAGADDALAAYRCPVPLGADESCHDRASLPGLKGRYQVVNIKLDKTGGLTEALALRAAAEAAGFGIMVGCMLGTSLAMAPAVLVGQGVGFVDLDGPLWLARDRVPGLAYDGTVLGPPEAALWG